MGGKAIRTSVLVGWLGFVLACGDETEGTISLQRPNSGEVLVAGTRQPIRWQSDGDESAFDIWLLGPAGFTLQIAEGVADGSSFTWDIPLVRASSPGEFSLRVVPAGAAPTASLRSASDRGRPLADGEMVAEADGLAVGSFAAVHWNASSSVEEYYWIDSVTGDTEVIGTVGDLETLPWPAALAADNTSKRVYVIGMDGANVQKLYTLDSWTGELLSTVEIADGMPDVVIANAAGELLGLRWSGDVEEVVRLHPDSGAQEVIGTVEGLQTWQSQTAVDVNQDRLYVVGMPNGGDPTLYTLVSNTAEFLGSAVITLDGDPLNELLGLAVNSEGAVLGFSWDGSVERMLRVDPSTGEATVLGTVGDLQVWSAGTALNLSNDNLYVIGDNGLNDKLYVMDARTSGDLPAERLLYDAPLQDYPSSALLVY